MVVNDNLGFATNRFDVLGTGAPPSQFDFNRHGKDTRVVERTMYLQESGWELWPAQAEACPQPTLHFDLKGSEPSHFSRKHHEGATGPSKFTINFDASEDRVFFTEQVDYRAYRTRSIVPKGADILKGNDVANYKRDTLPNFPVNRIRGAYKSTEEYLYTHFELMRNDLLIPLQRTVQSYRRSIQKADTTVQPPPPSSNAAPPASAFRVYEHVRLTALVFSSYSILFRTVFRPSYTENMNWESPKRLIKGSLVMLSNDNFQSDIKVATVISQSVVPMRYSNRLEYMIDIRIEHSDSDRDSDLPVDFGDPLRAEQDYVMIEPMAGYFEAYRHVMSVLQTISPEDLPFSSVLVDGSRDVHLPHYAAVKRIYDIAPYHHGQRQGPPMIVNIASQWPPYNIGLDSTQINALKTMLSNDIAIVQGSPGSGKTFVGTYAMRVLSNFSKDIGPIVCICQSNHALDQFLEHILRDNDEIVRVGSRSKSELMKDRNSSQKRK